jgi:hypothetical protein
LIGHLPKAFTKDAVDMRFRELVKMEANIFQNGIQDVKDRNFAIVATSIK